MEVYKIRTGLIKFNLGVPSLTFWLAVNSANNGNEFPSLITDYGGIPHKKVSQGKKLQCMA